MLFSTESIGSARDHGSIIGKNFPLIVISEPSAGLCILEIHFIKVLLPDPFGPITPSLSPLFKLKLIFFNAQI